MIQSNVFKIFDRIKKSSSILLVVLFALSLFFANLFLSKSNAYFFYMTFSSIEDPLFSPLDSIYVYVIFETIINVIIIGLIFKFILKKALVLTQTVDLKHASKCFWLFSIPFNILIGLISLLVDKYPYIFSLYIEPISFFITSIGYILFAYYYVQYAIIPKYFKSIFIYLIGLYFFIKVSIVIFGYLFGGMI